MAIVRQADLKRGRAATKPREMTWRGWKDVVTRVGKEIERDRVAMVSAAVAFYAMLAIFPAMLALIALYGLFFDRLAVEQQLAQLAGRLPASAAELVGGQLRRLVATSPDDLGFRFVVGVLVALWTASTGTASLLEAVNVAYDEDDNSRGFVQLRVVALRATLVALVAGAALVGSLSLVSWWLGDGFAARISRWTIVSASAVGGFTLLYRVAPNRRPPKWRWVMPGALLATLLWIGVNAGLALYVRTVSAYEATYGALGGAIVLLLWLFATVFVVLLGAELNAELEAQLARDTTEGPPSPIGERGAKKADEIAPLAAATEAPAE